MEPISRRTALTLGAIGAGVVVVGGGAFAWTRLGAPEPGLPAGTASVGPVASSELRQPAVVRSAGGRLDLTLVAAPSTVMIGETAVRAVTYNTGIPGPTLVVRGGDVVSIRLENRLPDPTNLHTHGLHVSPDGASDNVFRRIEPGASADYRYEIPANHPPGVYWYHPHHHGMAADQVFGGLYGAIIVEDSDPIPVTTERVLVISDITYDNSGTIAAASQSDRMNGREGATLLLNGQVGATLSARPGDRERWRIVNACSSRYITVTLPGQFLTLLGTDLGRFDNPQPVEGITLMPGNRADAIVTMAMGSSTLAVQPVDRGSAGGMGGR